MFARLFAIASLVAFAVANDGQCNTGSIQCCESSTTVSNYNAQSGLSGLLSIVTDVVGLVGLNCSPLSVIGLGSGCEANQEPLCCSNNQYNGLVNLGCSPINLNL
ncbi:fungal hydrophobin [Suillus paluster]|uniref:fungal hydrophobin n=1 Tax=Suillus paluster TaxID=48578 RepID=UPI001B887231|nr:fungal hydrophobin [Suillus paluster]KAG1738127.1 fungal hydrophobin [Suillus paluster]